jgi:hypothetical protein
MFLARRIARDSVAGKLKEDKRIQLHLGVYLTVGKFYLFLYIPLNKV